MVRSVRARGVVAAASLTLVSGCVLLTGVGDFEVVDGTNDGSAIVQPDSASPADVVAPPRVDVTTSPPVEDASVEDVEDASIEDASIEDASVDSSIDLPDTGPPDTGPPDTGPPDTGAPVVDSGPSASVGCTASLTCSGSTPICCFSAIGSSCVAGLCFAQTYACDDDADCTGGNVCCVSWNTLTFAGGSSCSATCATTSSAFAHQGRACTDAKTCGANETCTDPPSRPPALRACQPP